MSAEGKEVRNHWIYVLGGRALGEKAEKWAERKIRQGKAYRVVAGAPPGAHQQRLAALRNADVLYVFADAVREGRLGEWGIGPDELAAHLRAEGLDRGHQCLKIFASWSGDDFQAASYAELVYGAAHREYPQLVVYGYHGQVDAEGFDAHKTAGLGPGETLEVLSREQWLERGARARENRVRFPPEHP